MTWENIFNSYNIKSLKTGRTLDTIAKWVYENTTYRFFNFNGDIFFLDINGQYHNTDLLVENLK